MKIKILSFLFLVAIKTTLGQISFEKGYIIDNNNKKIECLILNKDWKNNPLEFTYKLQESDPLIKGTTANVKEFSVYGKFKYIRAYIEIDRSSNLTEYLSSEKNPIWSKEVLFLQVLVNGKASLYKYNDFNLERFFYSNSDTLIRQLVYKKYLGKQKEIDDYHIQDIGIIENNKFRQQLWSEIKCPATSMNAVKGIKYYQSNLEKYFINYNRCFGDSLAPYKKKNVTFNFRITPGINYSSLTTTYSNSMNETKFDFGKNFAFRIGLEAELILPFNKNKWGFVINPSFHYYNGESEYNNNMVKIRYKSIDFPIGVRYYVFLKKKTKLFFNAFFSPPPKINFNSIIDFKDITLNISESMYYIIGCGVGNDGISVEIRYSKNDILSKYFYWKSDYSRLALIFGIKLNKTKKS